MQAYCLRRQGRDQKLYERVGNSNWSHSSNPQFYDFRDVLKKKGLDMACEDITNNGNIARLEAVGGNSSHLLPEHAHCMINYLTNFMNNSEKNNHQKDPNNERIWFSICDGVIVESASILRHRVASYKKKRNLNRFTERRKINKNYMKTHLCRRNRTLLFPSVL